MKIFAAAVVVLALVSGPYLLVYTGVYGAMIFFGIPLGAGAVSCAFSRPRSGQQAVRRGGLTGVAALTPLVFFMWAGVLYLAMAEPAALWLGALGGWLVFRRYS